mmetsp:Transcript_41128/g.128365  ORF Transcript_41128/g.128365 Transcript_41128/m.128365 type:complete len:253 (+) Transcript_41128:228-986(+)
MGHSPEREKIDARAVGPREQDLGCDVAIRTHRLREETPEGVEGLHHAAHAEVDQLQRRAGGVRGVEEILRLQVPVDNGVRVAEGHGGEHLPQELGQLRLAEAQTRLVRGQDPLPELAARAVFHDEEHVLFILEAFEQADNMRVVGDSQKVNLVPQLRGVCDAGLRHSLHGHRLSSPTMCAGHDSAHGARAQLPRQIVGVCQAARGAGHADEVAAAEAALAGPGQQAGDGAVLWALELRLGGHSPAPAPRPCA